MKETDKLRVLIPHWIEHNGEHADEFRGWAEKAGAARDALISAAEMVSNANKQLKEALAQLGGPLQGEHAHRHHA